MIMSLHFKTFALGAILAHASSIIFPLIYHFKDYIAHRDDVEVYSSVWCNFGPSKERLCKFRNICYDPHYHEFQFYLSAESVVSGLNSAEAWKDIDISTVLGHNAFKMKVALMSAESCNLSITNFSETPVYILHRFKSDNLMHIVHDDLLPLHTTYESLSLSSFLRSDFSLFFTDDSPDTVFDEWYTHYSKEKPVRLRDLTEPICFANAYVGLLRNSVWFKYGFGEPQGPRAGHQVSVAEIHRFVKYNLQTRGISLAQGNNFPSDTMASVHSIVVIVRQTTRRILNLDIVVESIKKAHAELYPNYNLDLIKVNSHEQNFSEILGHVRKAKLLVGMHGADMIFSLFLPPASAVVELFPFGINPNHVSFMKALCNSSSLYPLTYEFWKNTVRENSRPGPQNNPLTGQISHLHPEEQKVIEEMMEVPAAQCCHKPDYLYYMYQDTIVTEDVVQPIHRALKGTRSFSASNQKMHENFMFPSSPGNVSCVYTDNDRSLNVTWGNVSNKQENWDLWFEVTIKYGTNIAVQHVRGDSRRFCLFELANYKPVDVWLLPFNGGIPGYVKHLRCAK